MTRQLVVEVVHPVQQVERCQRLRRALVEPGGGGDRLVQALHHGLGLGREAVDLVLGHVHLLVTQPVADDHVQQEDRPDHQYHPQQRLAARLHLALAEEAADGVRLEHAVDHQQEQAGDDEPARRLHVGEAEQRQQAEADHHQPKTDHQQGANDEADDPTATADGR